MGTTYIHRYRLEKFSKFNSFWIDKYSRHTRWKNSQEIDRDSLIEIGDPFQPFIYGQVSFPVKVALQYDVSLIMDGENGEFEYGGTKSASEKSFTLG